MYREHPFPLGVSADKESSGRGRTPFPVLKSRPHWKHGAWDALESERSRGCEPLGGVGRGTGPRPLLHAPDLAGAARSGSGCCYQRLVLQGPPPAHQTQTSTSGSLLCPLLTKPNFMPETRRAGLGIQTVKHPPAMQKTWVQPLGGPCGGGHGHPLQCSRLENPMDRGAWRATVHGVTQSQTRLSY